MPAKTANKLGSVRIRLQVEGGIAHFPGLARGREVVLERLPAEDARTAHALIERAHLRSLPGVVGAAPKGAADFRQYTLTLIENGKEHTVRIIEPIEDEALAQLVTFVQRHASAAGP